MYCGVKPSRCMSSDRFIVAKMLLLHGSNMSSKPYCPVQLLLCFTIQNGRLKSNDSPKMLRVYGRDVMTSRPFGAAQF